MSLIDDIKATLSKSILSVLRIEHRVQPGKLDRDASKYTYTDDQIPVQVRLVVDDGHDARPGGSGRTGAPALRVKVINRGAGDAHCFNGVAVVVGDPHDDPTRLGEPAGGIINGDCIAASDNAYLNPYEINCDDGGYKNVTAVGAVYNARRKCDDPGQEMWPGFRPQSKNNRADSAFQPIGPWRCGLDLVHADLDAPIVLREGQRVYLDGKQDTDCRSRYPAEYGGAWIEYRTGKIRFFVGGKQVAAFP